MHIHVYQNYLPLRHSGEGFDLEQSYKRFAFLRKLDIHKKEHANYESILRGTAQSDEADDEDEAELIIPLDHHHESESDEESDDD